MSKFGLCGPTYRSQSVNADCQLTQNLYPEHDEAPGSLSPIVMYPTPGTRVFGICPDQTYTPVRGMFVSYSTARVFAIIGTTFYEIASNGTMTGYVGVTLIDDGLPISWAENNAQQLIFCAGGQLWLFPLSPTATKGNLTDAHTITASLVGPAGFLNLQVSTDFNPATWFPAQGTVYAEISGGTNFPQYNLQKLQVSGGHYGSAPYTVALKISTDTSAGTGYVSDTGTVSLWSDSAFVTPLQVAQGLGPFTFVDYIDGYFIATVSNSQKFYISILEDGSAWNPIDVEQVSEFPDNIRSMIVNQEIVWFFGTTKTVPYYDSGGQTPFLPVPNILIEQGIAAPWSRVKADNSVFWIGLDSLGNCMAWRANGYTPQRVSTHAVEFAWSEYGQTVVAEAMAYAYQDQGHIFWVIYFPNANNGLGATWVYDIATQMWHVRSHHSEGVSGTFTPQLPFAEVAHLSRCHIFAYGKHLVGDWRSSTVLEMSIDIYDDFNTPSGGGIDAAGPATTEIVRIRRAPHVSTEQKFIRHNQLQVYLETGLATFTDGVPPVLRGPLASLRWSDDGGHSWSNYYAVECGQIGDFKKRVVWRRLGRARDRVYELSMSDPSPWRIVDAYLDVIPGSVRVG